MKTLTKAQNASLARVCTALRMGINKGHITVSGAIRLLSGDATTAAGELGLTLTRRQGSTTHDLDTVEVVESALMALSMGFKRDVVEALRELREDCYAAIERERT
nr:MAG: hypothetical protein [Bacteriophage sp.]